MGVNGLRKRQRKRERERERVGEEKRKDKSKLREFYSFLNLFFFVFFQILS